MFFRKALFHRKFYLLFFLKAVAILPLEAKILSTFFLKAFFFFFLYNFFLGKFYLLFFLKAVAILPLEAK